MLKFLGYLLLGWIALVVCLWVLSFALGLIFKSIFWISLIGIVVFGVMMLTKRRSGS